jgi:hypothetical protein
MNDAIKSTYATDLGRVQQQPLDERSLHLRRLIFRRSTRASAATSDPRSRSWK